MLTLRENFIEVLPYHQQTIANFYGGDQLQHIDNQFIANEFGHYSFNREFVCNIKKEEEDYIPYKFPDNQRFEDLRFELGKALSRNHSDIEQISVGKSSFLIG